MPQWACICVYICIYIYKFVYIYMYIYIYIYIYVFIFLSLSLSLFLSVYIYTYIHVYIYLCIHTSVFICNISIYMYVCARMPYVLSRRNKSDLISNNVVGQTENSLLLQQTCTILFVCMYVCMYVYMYICMFKFIQAVAFYSHLNTHSIPIIMSHLESQYTLKLHLPCKV